VIKIDLKVKSSFGVGRFDEILRVLLSQPRDIFGIRFLDERMLTKRVSEASKCTSSALKQQSSVPQCFNASTLNLDIHRFKLP
jgi:hypothetical protein